jgi:hypothetical protein
MAGVMEAGGWRGSASRLVLWAAFIALILLVPLVAMQFTDEVDWTPFDFAFAFTMLFGAGVVFELAARTTGSLAYRAGAGVAIVSALMLVWVTGAVGIIGTEDDAANLMYGGVLAVGIVGAIAARFQPDGMARAMFATAIAQALAAAVALAGGMGSDADPGWPRDIIGVTGMFVVLWLVSGMLFVKAGRERATVAAAL